MIKKIKNFLKGRANESGRSMVEMLGVLAIIGVLTIGGIAGYNFAMNRYRTNEILQGINMRYAVAQQQLTLGVPLNMSEFDDAILGKYKVEVQKVDGPGNMILMSVLNVPTDVAKQLLASGSNVWKLPILGVEIAAQNGMASNHLRYPQLISSAHAAAASCEFGDTVGIWFYFVSETPSCNASGHAAGPSINW